MYCQCVPRCTMKPRVRVTKKRHSEKACSSGTAAAVRTRSTHRRLVERHAGRVRGAGTHPDWLTKLGAARARRPDPAGFLAHVGEASPGRRGRLRDGARGLGAERAADLRDDRPAHGGGGGAGRRDERAPSAPALVIWLERRASSAYVEAHARRGSKEGDALVAASLPLVSKSVRSPRARLRGASK